MPDSLQDRPRRHRVTVLLVFAFVAAQFLLPLSRLGSPQTTRFSWQMFSRQPGTLAFFIVGTDGRTRKIPAHRYLGNLRGDLYIEDVFPPHLCRTFSTARSVRWTGADGAAKELPCVR